MATVSGEIPKLVQLADPTGLPIGSNANPLNVTAGAVTTPGYTRIEDGTSNALATVAQFHNADNQVIGTGNGILTGGVAQLWNGAGFDRARSNLAVTLVPSAAYATTQTSADQLNVNGHCLHVILDVTVIGTATVTLAINGKDPASGKYYPLLTGAAVVGTGTNVYKVGPALTAAANSVANDWVPRTFQIVATLGGSGSATFSVGYNLSE